MKKARILGAFSVLLLLCTQGFPQQFTEDDKKEGKMKSKTFAEHEPGFELKDVPEKWKNESAVILNQKFEYSFLQKYKNIEFEQVYRKRIKLLDKASVEDFSQFYWQTPYKQTGQVTLFGGDNSNKFYIEIKIIKPNGTVVDVNTKDAVEIKESEWTKVPRIFRGSSGSGYRKLAIPNLEPGDILDYFYFKRLYVSDKFFSDFGATVVSLTEKYPIKEQKYLFILERNFFVSMNTYNGAQKISSKADQIKYSGLKANDKVMVYSLVDNDREKFTDEPWSYELVNYPILKFRVIYPVGGYKGSALKGEDKGVLKENFSSEEIIRNFQDNSAFSYANPGEAVKYVKTKMGAEKDVKKIADELYYATRFYAVKNSKSYSQDFGGWVYAYKTVNLKKYYEGFAKEIDHIKYQNKKMTEAIENKQFGVMDHDINPSSSMAFFCKALEKFKIPYKVVLAPERQYGKIEDIMFTYEYEPLVMVEDGAKKYFYYTVGYDRTADLTNYNVEGVEAIAYSPATFKKDKKVERVKIPVSGENFNKLNIKTSIDFKPADFENIQFKRELRVSGDYKYDYSYLNWMNDSCDFEDMRIYEKDFAKKFKPKFIKGLKVKEEESRKLIAEYHPLRYKVVKAYTEESLKDDYNLEKIDTLYLLENGRYDNKKDIVFKENFKVKDLASKLGNNFSLNIGKVIGDQLIFEDKHKKDRKTNVDIIFPRTIEYEFTIEIPAGYKIEGIKDLNVNVDNEVGSFTSIASTMDNTILVKTKKVYKHNFEKKENWSKLMEVIDAAYNFSQKKVIIKKQ